MNNFLLTIYLIANNAIACIAERFSERFKEILLFTSSFVIALIGIIRYCNDRIQKIAFYDGSSIRVLSTLMFIIILVAVVERKSFRKKINVFFWIGWILCFGLMFALSFVHPVKKDYFLWSILCLTLLPMIMTATNQNERWLKLTIIIARSFVLASFVFVLLSLVVTPFTTKEIIFVDFLGICSNPNNNGLICTAYYTAALYLLITDKNNKFIYLLSMCLCIVITMIAGCRTGVLAIAIETSAAAVIYCKQRTIYKTDVKWHSALLALIAAILLSFTAGYVLTKLDYMDLNAYAMSEYEEANEWVYSDALRTKINAASSGRLIIWWAYTRHLIPFGNGCLDGPLMPEYDASRWAHNNALDIGYVSGYIAMSGYLLWLFAVIVFIIRNLFKKGHYRKEYLLGILSFIGYFIQAMLEITIYPMSNGIAFLCFMTLGAAAFYRGEEETEKHNKGLSSEPQ